MKIMPYVGAAILSVGLTAVVAGCDNSPTTISSKYQCTQTVNGHKEKAYCVQDSDGSNYYLTYAIWSRVITGQNEDKYMSARYTSEGSHSPPEEDVPAAFHPAPVDDPVHVDPVVDGR